MDQPIDNLVESSEKKSLLEDLATKHVGPMVITGLEVIFKVSNDVSLEEEMSTHKVLVDSVGLWNCLDVDVFKKNVDKKFPGTLCVGKRAVQVSLFDSSPPINSTIYFFLQRLLRHEPWHVSS